jgi:hypothetical protein
MADYNYGNRGGSLRDALNSMYPMTGLGEYGAMFPPNTGAPQAEPPVPIPRPRPPMLPPQAQGLPPPQAGMPPPGLPQMPQGLPPPGMPQGQLVTPPGMPGVAGGLQMPINPNLALTAGGRFGGPQDYATRLGMAASF